MKKYKNQRKRWMNVLYAFSIVCSISGCTTSNAPTQHENKEQVVRIGVDSAYDFAVQKYVDLFEITHPNIRIEIVPIVLKEDEVSLLNEMKKKMQGDQPVDIIIAHEMYFLELAQENLLAPLEPICKQASVNIDDIVSSVQNDMKKIGNGTLYGMPICFSSEALYFNKKKFTEAGIDLPKDDMTWPEVFALAKRMTKKEEKDLSYGFAFSRRNMPCTWFLNFLTYVCPLGIKTMNDEATETIVDTPQWQEALTTIYDLIVRDKVFPPVVQKHKNAEGGFYEDYFKNGKVAMQLGSVRYAYDLIEHNERANTDKKYEAIDWDVVTFPSHPSQRNIGGLHEYNYIIGVNNKGNTKSDAVKKYIGFVLGEQVAKHQANSVDRYMSIYKKHVSSSLLQNFNTTAFYKKQPASFSSSPLFAPARKHISYYNVIYSGEPFFNEMMEGKMTPKQVSKAWSEAGNKKLQEINQELKAKK